MSLGVLNQSIVELHKRMQPRDWDPDEKLRRAARKEKVRQRVEANKARALAGEVTAETPDKTFEVSTKGDDLGKQFSALNATFQEGPYAGRTIEDVWQKEIKKSGKGKPPSKRSILYGKSYTESKAEYEKLWSMWVEQNPEAAAKLKAKVDEGYKLVDSFAGDPNKTVNQAEALTNVLNNMGTEEVKVETVKRYTVEDVRANPDKIYIYGDNLERIGKKNQSIIRDEPNALGIATKKAPSMGENAFFTDDEFEANKKIIDEDIAAIKADGRTIVLPEDGIGTGLASLKNRAPKTFAYLQEQLEELKGGTVSEIIFNQVDPNPRYPGRTEYNAVNSDITYDFAKGAVGSGATKKHAGNKHNWVGINDDGLMTKPKKPLAEAIAKDLLNGKTVNIAGHGIYKATRRGSVGFTKPISQSVIDNEMVELFQIVDEIIGDNPITGKVISGGQSGFDKAGAQAAHLFGIPTEVNYSGEGLWRDSTGKDIDNFDSFKARFDTFQPGSLGAARVHVPDEIIENQTNVPEGTLKRMFSSVPGYAVVPLEQLVEDVLSVTKWKGAVKPWITYELKVFGASIVGGLVGAIAGAGGAMAAGTIGPSVMNLSAGREVVPTKKIREQIPERALIQAIQIGGEVMSNIVKASPSYWIDEYLLKKYEDELPTEDTKFMEGGWQTWFPQLGVPYAKVMDRYTENAEKPSYDYLKGLSK